MPVNVAITQDTANPYSESEISINPYDTAQIIAGSNANSGSTQAQYWSSNGGGSWSQSSLPARAADDFQSDPAVGWTSDGTAWALTCGVNFTSTGNVIVRSFKSANGGKDWSYDSDVSGTQTATDKPALWVDRSGTSFKDNMYAIWHLGATAFVSVRKGPSGAWATPLAVSGAETTFTADGGDITTNGNGDVFAFWPDAGGQTLRVAKSTDGGTSFTALTGNQVKIANTFGSFTIKVPAQAARATNSGSIGTLISTSGGAFRSATQDLVFVCWADLAGGAGCNIPGDAPDTNTTSTCKTRIWFARSTDGGQHWQPAQKINDQASINDQFFPRLAVDDATGALMVVYYDTVSDPNRVKTDIWTQASTDFGATWSTAALVTTAQTDESTGSQDNSQQYGDYIGMSGASGAFFACWTDRRGGGDEQIYGAPLVLPNIHLAFGKTTYSADEVAAEATWDPAYFLQVGGFANKALGFNAPGDLNTIPSVVATITPSVDASLNPSLTASQIATIAANLPTVDALTPPILADDPTLKEDLQVFFYPYSVSFPANTAQAFNALNLHQSVFVTLSATLAAGNATASANALIELAKGEDPYFEDIDVLHPKDYPSWLSYDLQFFKVTPNQSHQMFSVPNPTGPDDAIRYIQAIIHNLNNPGQITNGDTFAGALSQDEENSALEFLPADKSNNPTFDFAVARVRLLGNSSVTIAPVRVFFRLFNAQTTVSNFDESTTYRWGTDGSANHKIPLVGVQANQNGQLEWVTIPCFATERVNLNSPADMHTQHDDPNAQSITTNPGVEVDTYFGCWLDLNQPGQTFLAAAPPTTPSQWDGPWPGGASINSIIQNAPHQCLIAEIRFDDTPVPPGATTSTSDKLAQRNIAWIDGPNPGQDPSRIMPHPFEVAASSASVDEIDELLITWGITPAHTTASIYLPAVKAADVIALADRMYSSHRLIVLDENTVGCHVGGATLIPVPKGEGRYAGLLSVNLPSGIRRGDRYDIVVRQLTEASVTPVQSPQLTIARAAAAPAVAAFSWRRTLGTFQVTITISMKERLLFPEERLLAWLKWKLVVVPATLRWYPVLQRYLGLIAGRVQGFGGDPAKIPPSEYGNVPGHPHFPPEPQPHEPHRHEFTGKVASLLYDRFGDFEGFILLTEKGHEHRFSAHEREIEELVKCAWIERSVISVFVEHHRPHVPAAIALRRH